jgi:hypothetical protein
MMTNGVATNATTIAVDIAIVYIYFKLKPNDLARLPAETQAQNLHPSAISLVSAATL